VLRSEVSRLDEGESSESVRTIGVTSWRVGIPLVPEDDRSSPVWRRPQRSCTSSSCCG